jgi:ribosomal protein S18 acetylase RimI-like enzyme
MFEEESLAPGFNVRGNERCDVPTIVDPIPISGVSNRSISLDPVSAADEPVLYQTFASTRADEMALTGWSEEQKESFLRMQYEAQRSSYLMQIPDAEYSVIRCDGKAVGRLIVERGKREIHLVDIALLPEFRAKGIGSTLMEAILMEARLGAKTVRLHVERFNPALHWYERLGFEAVNGGPIYLEMVWRPGGDALVAGERVSESGSTHLGSEVGNVLCRSI